MNDSQTAWENLTPEEKTTILETETNAGLIP